MIDESIFEIGELLTENKLTLTTENIMLIIKRNEMLNEENTDIGIQKFQRLNLSVIEKRILTRRERIV